MPPLPSPGNVIRINFTTEDDSGVEAGSRFYCSYHGSPPSAGTLSSLATAVTTAWGTELAPLVASTDTLTFAECIDLSSSSGNVGAATVSIAGTNSHSALPPSIATNVNHLIGRRYRGGKPRTSLRAGTTNDVDGTLKNHWSSTYLTNAKAGWQAFISDVLGTSGANLSNVVNVSYYEGFTPVLNPVTGRTRDVPKLRTAGPVVDIITDAAIGLTLGSQRRRLR